MKRTTIIETVIFLYTVLFLYTGISKIIDHNVFKENIADLPILSSFAELITWGIPIAEFAITLFLIIPRWRSKGLLASLILMILFTGYVISLLLFDEKLPCSCGGIIQQLSWSQHLIFNGVFIALAILAIILQRKEKRKQQTKWNLNSIQSLSNREHFI